ncbi:hypothetical protein CEXT_785121 [Caerostris extrusa]|uniref:Uncharacterized protein n=1 Tax=Caerostris extrusa TaxID=172846 RepID=A0AAV4RR98_CAEEX|nr:hypothetical protein CEXT_785121 [Caerostris extrusa]
MRVRVPFLSLDSGACLRGPFRSLRFRIFPSRPIHPIHPWIVNPTPVLGVPIDQPSAPMSLTWPMWTTTPHFSPFKKIDDLVDISINTVIKCLLV